LTLNCLFVFDFLRFHWRTSTVRVDGASEKRFEGGALRLPPHPCPTPPCRP
jgi:hypothetical protein